MRADEPLPGSPAPARTAPVAPPVPQDLLEQARLSGAEIDITTEFEVAHNSSQPPPRPSRPSSPPELPAITTFGKYEILGRVAFGGMAEIFLARERTAVGERHLAIKRVLPHVAHDSDFVRMFLDEARLAMMLNHPNICHIYEFGRVEGSYFIAMEWVYGQPLGKVVRRARGEGGVPKAVAVRVAAEVAAALDYAHRAKDPQGRALGIVHRDVTPHNVMVGYDGIVRLLDFGIAKARTHNSKTEAGVIKGKFAYMSPQQCVGEDVDGRADVFALGVCLYEALTGQPLYHRKNEFETMKAVLDEPVPSARSVDPTIPPPLDRIVQTALAKRPEDRYATAGHFERDLVQWIASTGAVADHQEVAVWMEKLYAEDIRRGPLVDSTPFGQSFVRVANEPPVQAEGIDRLARAPSTTSLVPRPKPPSRVGLVAAGLGLVVLGAGLATWAGGRLASPPPSPPAPLRTIGATPAGPGPIAPPPVVEGSPSPSPPPSPTAVPPSASTGRIVVTSDPPGARVAIDGADVPGETPVTIDAAPGVHELRIARDGRATETRTVEVVVGVELAVDVELEAVDRAPPGRLSINTRPWSKVYVGGRLLGTTPIGGERVPSGRVRLRLVDRDGRTHSKQVDVRPGAETTVFFDLN